MIYCENNLGIFLFYIYRTFRMEKLPKNAQSFYCEKCDFKCSKKSNYENHLRTAKHRNRTISNDFSPKNAEYFCECGKRYKARNSLWYHKKKCTYIETSVDSCGTDDGIFIEGEFGDEKDDGRYVSKIRASFKYYK